MQDIYFHFYKKIMQKIFTFIYLFFSVSFVFAQNQSDSTQKKPNLISTDLGKGTFGINAYVDFGYVVGPQGKHRYFDYILNDTVEDFGRRDYTSYPLYANQFSLSYGYIQAQYEIKDKVRLRFALHAGHVVESLYYGEKTSLRSVREAAIYYYFSPKIAIEAGIFPSYYGAEIVLFKENLHSTRAYIADFTPDYEAGVRLHYHANKYNTLRFMLLNGWQEIKDENGRKALGFTWSLNNPNKIVGDWNMYFGNEAPAGSTTSLYRFYVDWYYKIWLGKRWIVFPMFDYVVQERPMGMGGFHHVTCPAISVRYILDKKQQWSATGRYEYLMNKSDIVQELYTGTANGWQSHSYTFTLEYAPLPQVTFRAEGRYGWNKDRVFRGSNNEKTDKDMYGIFTASFHF